MSNRRLSLNPATWISGGLAVTLIIVIAIVVAIQQREDAALEESIERSASKLQTLGDQIADIKDSHLVSMNDYIGAYAQIAPLETEYDHQLDEFRDLYDRAQDRSRRTINIRRFRTTYRPEVWRNMSEILDITTQLSALIKRQTSVVHEMASLPEGERLRFWHEQFVPLEMQEHALRERLVILGRGLSPEPESQSLSFLSEAYPASEAFGK